VADLIQGVAGFESADSGYWSKALRQAGAPLQ